MDQLADTNFAATTQGNKYAYTAPPTDSTLVKVGAWGIDVFRYRRMTIAEMQDAERAVKATIYDLDRMIAQCGVIGSGMPPKHRREMTHEGERLRAEAVAIHHELARRFTVSLTGDHGAEIDWNTSTEFFRFWDAVASAGVGIATYAETIPCGPHARIINGNGVEVWNSLQGEVR